jgi:proteasome lid subunit RPN8/RPN11
MKMWKWFKRSKSKSASAAPATVWISASLMERTAAVLRQSRVGDETHEGVAYWAGHRAGADCFITTCIAPAARTTRGSFDTSARANARVVMYLANAGLELLGQVHSHAGRFVDHSDGDDERALMPYGGFLSIVVPHYARGGMRPLTACGIHVFDHSRFRRLPDAEVEACFHIVDDFADLRK